MNKCMSKLGPTFNHKTAGIFNVVLIFTFCMSLMCLPSFVCGAETLTLTLEEAVERALKYNKGIALAKEKVKESEAGQSVARAKFFPYISASASYTRLANASGMELTMPTYGMTTLPVLNGLGVPTGDVVPIYGITGLNTLTYSIGSENIYDLRLSLQYPFFTWWKISNAYKIASLGLDATKEDLRKKENETKLSVTESFLRVQLAQSSLKLAGESMEQLKQHADQANDLYEAGKISKLDLLRAKVQLSSVKVQVAQAENGLALAGDALKNLLGLGLEDKITLKGELEYKPCEVFLSEAISTALANRSEIRSVALSVEMSRRSLEIARAGNKPNFVLAGNYDYKNPAGSGDAEWGTDWSINISVSLPLFQGGEITGKIRQAEAQLEQVKLGKEQLEEGIKMEVRNAFIQLNSSRELLGSQQENIKEAREALEIAEDRYMNGLITNLECLDAQVALSRAEADYVRTLADYLIAVARLEKAMNK